MLEDEENLIDKFTPRGSDKALLAMVKWWEKKRLYFNLIILAASVLVLQSAPQNHIYHGEWSVRMTTAIFNLIGANFCYSLGWGIGILKMYYFKSHPATTQERWTLFIIGSAFSFLVTFIGL